MGSNLSSWAVSRGSAGPTIADRIADGLAYLAADPSLIPSSLVPWVRACRSPTGIAPAAIAPAEILAAVETMDAGQRARLAELLGVEARHPIL